MTEQHRSRRAPQGPRLDPADRPDPDELREQRALATRRRPWNRSRR